MTQDDATKYWFNSAGRNLKVAKDNYRLKHYDWALFFYHLTIEKLLKGLIIKKGNIPPPSHDLSKLWKLSESDLKTELVEYLSEITTYNIEARYDDYKQSFYKKATKNYTDIWIIKCEKIVLWLKKQY